MPIVSLSVQEAEIGRLHADLMSGHYLAWNYLSNIESASNREFKCRWREICVDSETVPNDALEATFIGFNLWKMAVERASSADMPDIRRALRGATILAPSGYELVVTPDQHTTLPAFVGKVDPDGSTTVVWSSRTTITPSGSRSQIGAAA